MKYWRGYLVAAILGFFSWALLDFAKNHTQLVDMFYPYSTRMIQGTLAQWSGGTDQLLWQLLLVLFVVVTMAAVILMVILRWNPIQILGWVLAVASLVLFLNTGLYGLNEYAGPLATDIKLTTTEYTLPELEQAATYYRNQANELAGLVKRDETGDVNFAEFDRLAEMAGDGYQYMTYLEHKAVFYGAANAVDSQLWTEWETHPVKELGWADWFSSVGITGLHIPLTGEIAVNTQIPAVAQPFIICREMAYRLCIANEGDAAFAAYLACQANPSPSFQYSAAMMAYLSCREALEGLPGEEAAQALEQIQAQESEQLRHDLMQYETFFAVKRDPVRTERLQMLSELWDDTCYNVRDFLGVESLNVETDAFHDLLVSWHIQEIILPTQIPEEEEKNLFDPYNEDYINGLVDLDGNPIEPTTEPTEETTAE